MLIDVVWVGFEVVNDVFKLVSRLIKSVAPFTSTVSTEPLGWADTGNRS